MFAQGSCYSDFILFARVMFLILDLPDDTFQIPPPTKLDFEFLFPGITCQIENLCLNFNDVFAQQSTYVIWQVLLTPIGLSILFLKHLKVCHE